MKEEMRSLTCDLTQEDIRELLRENGEDRARVSELKAEAAALNKQMDGREREIRSGTTKRSVLCRWSYNFTTNQATLKRTDTGDAIEQRPMTPNERQITIDGTGEPTPADIVGKGATTIEAGIRWAGRRHGPEKGPGGEPVRKDIAIAIRPEDALWNGHRWLVQSDEADRSMTEVKVRTNEGEEKLHPMDSVWVSSWPSDPPKAEPAPKQLPPAPKQLPPAPSPSTAELRAELDADEIAYADLAADLRSIGKIALESAIASWTVTQCREASDYVGLMHDQRMGVDVGDPVCPPHVAALPEYHRGEPGEIVDAEFDDPPAFTFPVENMDAIIHARSSRDDIDFDDSDADELPRNPIDAIIAESAIPEHIEDEPEPPAKPSKSKTGGKAKGKAGNAPKGRRKPAAE